MLIYTTEIATFRDGFHFVLVYCFCVVVDVFLSDAAKQRGAYDCFNRPSENGLSWKRCSRCFMNFN